MSKFNYEDFGADMEFAREFPNHHKEYSFEPKPKLAKLNQSFTTVQWHGEEYPYYESDAEENAFLENEVVEVLKQVGENPMGKLYVIYCERNNNSTVVSEHYLNFI